MKVAPLKKYRTRWLEHFGALGTIFPSNWNVISVKCWTYPCWVCGSSNKLPMWKKKSGLILWISCFRQKGNYWALYFTLQLPWNILYSVVLTNNLQSKINTSIKYMVFKKAILILMYYDFKCTHLSITTNFKFKLDASISEFCNYCIRNFFLDFCFRNLENLKKLTKILVLCTEQRIVWFLLHLSHKPFVSYSYFRQSCCVLSIPQ